MSVDITASRDDNVKDIKKEINRKRNKINIIDRLLICLKKIETQSMRWCCVTRMDRIAHEQDIVSSKVAPVTDKFRNMRLSWRGINIYDA